jgi:hypothetical protein
MRIRDIDETCSAKLAWDLFKETGEIGYYMLFKELNSDL